MERKRARRVVPVVLGRGRPQAASPPAHHCSMQMNEPSGQTSWIIHCNILLLFFIAPYPQTISDTFLCCHLLEWHHTRSPTKRSRVQSPHTHLIPRRLGASRESNSRKLVSKNNITATIKIIYHGHNHIRNPQEIRTESSKKSESKIYRESLG